MRCKLGDISEITKLAGYEFTKYIKYIPDGEIIAVRALNLKNGALVLDDIQRISKEVSETLPRSQLHKNDIVLSYTGTLGECAQIREDGKYHLAPNVCKITPNDSVVNPNFLFQYIRCEKFKQTLINYAHGSTQPTIPMSTIRDIPVDIPDDLEKQGKIAAILSILDEKIAINRAINDNLEQQARALYQRMFIDNPVSGGYMGTLSDIADITMGQSPNGSSYNEDGNGAVFFQGRAEFGFRFPSVRLYTTEPKRMACANDTLMSVRAPVGDLNVAYTDCCIGRGLAAMHSKSNQQSFVLYTMFSLHKQLDVFNGEGTVFGSINRTSLTELPIFIPSDREIVKFEDIVAPIDAAIRNNYEEICRLEKIRDALLPKLMSGELDVSAVEL